MTLTGWPCLLHVKEPKLLFEKSKGSFPCSVVNLSRITHHSYHRLWVGYVKLINELIVAASGALYAEV